MLVLVVERMTLPLPGKVTDVCEGVRTLLPPPPPPPLPVKVTVMATAVTPPGAVGVRVTLAEAPGFTPEVVPILKCKLAGVVVPPDTFSHPVREPVESIE